MADSDYFGLTRNPWPGTWSPQGDQPIALDRELRGSLRWISGDSADRLSTISGQRLQNGMLVYVQNDYVDSAADSSYGWTTDSDVSINSGYYVYFTDSSRNELTGRLQNTPDNWTKVDLFGEGIDSEAIISLIDSDYVNARVNIPPPGVDSDYIDARIQVLDVSDIVGEVGLRNEILRADGLGNAYWDNVLLLDSEELIKLVDSDYVRARQSLDSASTLQLINVTVDSDYVLSKIGDLGIDSDAVQILIDSSILEQVDSAYVQLRTEFNQAAVDSAVLVSLDQFVDSEFLISVYGQRLVDSNYLDARIQTLTIPDIVGSPAEAGQFLRGTGYFSYWDTITLLESAEVNLMIDSSLNEIDSNFLGPRLPKNLREIGEFILDSDDVLGLIDIDYINSIINIVDSDYIDARFQILELSDIIREAPTAKNQLLISPAENQDPYYYNLDSLHSLAVSLLDSTNITDLIDTGYIFDIATTAGLGLDSNEVAGIILGPQFANDSVARDTFTGVDSAYVQFRVDADKLFDSSKVQAINDSNHAAFILGNNPFDSVGPLERLGFEFLLPNFIDSAYLTTYINQLFIVENNAVSYEYILTVIDSSGGIVPTDSGITGLIDSAYILAVADSAFVKSIINADYLAQYVLDSNEVIQLVEQYGTDSGEIRALINSDLTDQENGAIPQSIQAAIQSIDIGDVVGDNGTANFFLQATGNGNAQWTEIEEYLDRFDSAEIFAIIDSAYINFRIDSSTVRQYIDPAFLAQYIDSAWINSRWDSNQFFLAGGGGGGGGIDSALVIQLIDSAYVQQRQALVDSASIIQLVDSAYVVERALDEIEARIQAQDVGDIVGANGQFNQVLRSLGTGEAEWVDVDATIDSALVTGIIDSAYINERVEATGGIDSALVIQLIDSAYVQARAPGVDSAAINQIIDSAVDSDYVISKIGNEIDARIQVLDVGDVVGNAGLAGQYLRSLGTGDAEWVDITDNALDSAKAIDLIDSAYVLSRLGPGFGTALDSALAIQLIEQVGFDSSNALALIDEFALDSVTAIPLIQQFSVDSNEVITFIDSAYINFRVDATIDSESVFALIDSAYVRERAGTTDSGINDLIDAKVQVLDIGDIVGAAGLAGQVLSSLGTGDAQWIDVLDSNDIVNVIDSSYIKQYATDSSEILKLVFANSIDSAGTITLIDSSYVLARVGDVGIDSDSIIQLIDSSYVVSRATSEIDAKIQVIDVGDIVGAAGLAGQYLRSLGTGDAEWIDIGLDALDSNAVIGLIDSSYVNSRVDPQQLPNILDSANIIDLVDSAYVNQRVDPAVLPNILDSANIIDLIDSSYVNARVIFDSNEVLGLIDSAYVNERVAASEIGIDSASTIALIDSAYVVERAIDQIDARVQAIDLGDVVGANGTSGQVLSSLGTGEGQWIDAFDSGETLNLILATVDSAYVSDRVVFDSAETLTLIFANSIDSAGTTTLIDSAYINFRVDATIDSDAVFALIDSAYVSARTVFDSEETLTLIFANSIDSNGTVGLIDSAYVTERSEDNAAAQIQATDLGDIVGSNGTSGQYLQSLGTGDGQWTTVSVPSFLSLQLDSALSNDSATVSMRMPVAGSISHISMQLTVETISASQSLSVNLIKNGVATGDTISVDAGTAGGAGSSAATATVTFAANDVIALNLVPSDATMVTDNHFGTIRILTDI